MSHELEDNKERRKRILAKMRQHPSGMSYQKLVAMIMSVFGYNLRGAKEKVRELSFMGSIKEKDLRWFDASTLIQSHSSDKERLKVTKGSVQDEGTRQEES